MSNSRNNPGNVKSFVEGEWIGQVDTDDKHHIIFSKDWEGIRCMCRCLLQKYKAGKKNVLDILNSWAPTTDTQGSVEGAPPNDPTEYAKGVVSFMNVMGCNVQHHDDLKLLDKDNQLTDIGVNTLIILIQAMDIYENRGCTGWHNIKKSDMLVGVASYLKSFEPDNDYRYGDII